MLTWPLRESLQGVCPVQLVPSKTWWESEPGMCKSQGITGECHTALLISCWVSLLGAGVSLAGLALLGAAVS